MRRCYEKGRRAAFLGRKAQTPRGRELQSIQAADGNEEPLAAECILQDPEHILVAPGFDHQQVVWRKPEAGKPRGMQRAELGHEMARRAPEDAGRGPGRLRTGWCLCIETAAGKRQGEGKRRNVSARLA